jgi:transcriptional regulator with XRE-family HTH domain
VDAVRVGHSIRALRLRRGWRQVDLGARAGVSHTTISRIEAGRLDPIPTGVLARTVSALDASLDVRVRWNGEALDRLLDQAHAGLVDQVVALLAGNGWATEIEATFGIRGERGSVDVLGYHTGSRMVLVIEVKSVVPDVQATIASLDRKARLAHEIGRSRGWECRGVSRLLVIGASSTSYRRVNALRATFRTAFPSATSDVRAWVANPHSALSGLLFLPFAQPVHGRRSTTGMRRVRRARAQAAGSHLHGTDARAG